MRYFMSFLLFISLVYFFLRPVSALKMGEKKRGTRRGIGNDGHFSSVTSFHRFTNVSERHRCVHHGDSFFTEFL